MRKNRLIITGCFTAMTLAAPGFAKDKGQEEEGDEPILTCESTSEEDPYFGVSIFANDEQEDAFTAVIDVTRGEEETTIETPASGTVSDDIDLNFEQGNLTAALDEEGALVGELTVNDETVPVICEVAAPKQQQKVLQHRR